ncbi:MAG: ribosome-associated translation inhibitor RaiA [Candidatus Magasanikbacteria bacterium]|nr:ribosome-associated translation inhibitor RaiA [Candidatus Magasanikbacteria bacterium]
MKVQITGKGMELTEAIKEYATKKAEALNKFYNNRIIRAEIVVGINNAHHRKGDMFMAEYKLDVPGQNLFAVKQEENLYKAIDQVRDLLESELKKYKRKQRVSEKDKKVGRKNKEYQVEL